MALKILKSAEPLEVKNIVVAIYSNPGIGKTTLGFTGDAALLLDFDGGAYRAGNRGDTVQITAWEDAANITAEDLADYNTVVVDTAGRALDFLTTDIIRRNPKLGRGAALTLQGYGALKSEFTSWLKSLRTMGKDVVLIAHSSEDKNGDYLIERLDVQGGSKQEIYKSADAMGRIQLINGKRVLNFSPTDTAFGKNPGNLSPLPVPDIATEKNFLADVISTIKGNLNSLSAEQLKRQGMIADWQATISECKTAEEFNAQIATVAKADKSIVQVVKGMLHKAATDSGLQYDAKKKAYFTPEAA
jgi:hypothetical protein